MDGNDKGRDLPFSVEALREKYRLERKKRLRNDGIEQYRSFTQLYSEDDPYTERLEREAHAETVEVAIIGGGFGGLLTGAHLHGAGIDDFRIIEKAGDFGGTWYWNRYPGARCDVESYIYLPLLEETGYVPTEKYATAAEILGYCQLLGRSYGLYNKALFQTEVKGLDWIEAEQRWRIATDRSDTIMARFVVVAGGVLHKPKLPGIPGIESFEGHSFHTSRWDYAYTGGDAEGGMIGLADKRVGLIGTGATAIQAIPPLARGAGHLYVLQRTPSGVGVRGNAETDREWFASLAPGWQDERMANFTFVTAGGYTKNVLVQDGWTDVFVPLAAAAAADPENAAEQRQLADYRNMEQIRARVDAIVQDPVTAELLKPYYNQMCKRPTFHDEYLATFNRANVTLVDTDGKGADRITPKGVVVGGTEFELDCLIYATGFEVSTAYTRRLGFDIVGRDGLSLTTRLDEGARTLFGVHSRDFPNLMLFTTTQAGASINFVHVLAELSQHAAEVISRSLKLGAVVIEPSEAACDAWFGTILSRLSGFGEFQKECTPGYFNAESSSKPGNVRNVGFVGDANEYFAALRDWRRDRFLEGIEVTYRDQADGPVAQTVSGET